MWWNEYVGIPFLAKGRDKAGADCWGLARLIYKEQFNIDLPSFAEEYEITDTASTTELFAQYKESWEQTTEPKPGTLILFRILGNETHVGVYIGNEKFIHVREGHDCVVESLQSVTWQNRVVGFFNYTEKSCAVLNAVPHPLKTQRFTVPVEPGTTIAELQTKIFNDFDLDTKLYAESKITILLNGKVVAKEAYSTTTIKDSDVLEYRAVPEGGALRLVLTLAVVFVAPYLGAQLGALIAGVPVGVVGAGYVAAGTLIVSTIGMLLIGAIMPIRPPSMPSDPGSAAAQLLMQSGSNQATKYGAIPVVLGKVRYTAPLGAQNYVDSSLNNSYLNMSLIWGFGPLQVSDIHIGANSIDQYSNGKGIPIECITLNDSTSDLATLINTGGMYASSSKLDQYNAIAGKDVKQVYKGVELTSNPTVGTPGPWISTVLDQDNITKLDITLHFPQGLRNLGIQGDYAGKIYEQTVQFNLEYRTLDVNNNPTGAWSDSSTLYIPEIKTVLAAASYTTSTWGYTTGTTTTTTNYYRWTRIAVNRSGTVIIKTGALTETPTSEPSAAFVTAQKANTYGYGVPTAYVRLPALDITDIPLYDICMYGSTVYSTSTAARTPSLTTATSYQYQQIGINLNNYSYSSTSIPSQLALTTVNETAAVTNNAWNVITGYADTGNVIATISAGSVNRSSNFGGYSITLGGTEIGVVTPNYISNSGTTLVVASTTGIVANMLIAGNGYNNGQRVVSVTNSTTLVTSAAPDGTPVVSKPITFGGKGLSQYVKRQDAFSHTETLTVPPSRYEVRIRRVTTDLTEESPNFRPQYVSILQTVSGTSNTKAIIDPPGCLLTRTALRIRATDQLNGNLEGINALVQTICPDWDAATNTWITRPTNNPASLFLYVLMHPANAHRVKSTTIRTSSIVRTDANTLTINYIAQRFNPFTVGTSINLSNVLPTSFNGNYTVTACTTAGIVLSSASTITPGTVTQQGLLSYSEVSDKVNLTALRDWHVFCNSDPHKFTFNAIVSQQRSIIDVLRDIAAAGRASPAMVDGKWTVIIDQPRTDIVQHFTPHNSWGFEGIKRLPQVPDGLKVTFSNEALGYQEDEAIVYNTGKTEANSELFEQIYLPGTTDRSQVVTHARWHMAQAKLRPEIFTLNTDLEYLVCNRGDRVKVLHDVPQWGTASGRIKNRISSTVFELDEQLPLEAGVSYTIRVRSKTGGSVVRTVQSVGTPGYYTQITITASATAAEIDANDLFMFGQVNSETADLIVLGIEPFGNQNAKITLVDYAPDLYTVNYQANNFTVPAYKTNITQAPRNLVQSINYKPVITSIISDERVMELISPGIFKYNIKISFDNPIGLPTDVAYIQSQIDYAGDSVENWQTSVPVSRATKSITIGNVQEDSVYRLRLRYVGNDGRTGPWQETLQTIVSGTTWTGGILTVITYVNHSYVVGDKIAIYNYNTGFNGIYTILSVPSTKTFTVAKATNPGTWSTVAVYQDVSEAEVVLTPYLSTIGNILHKVVGKSNPPATASGLSIAADYGSGNLKLTWATNTEIDIKGYEVRTENANWGIETNASARVFLGNSLTSLATPAALGVAKTFYLKAFDYSGNYSVNATTATYTVVAPTAPTAAATYSYADTSTTDSTVTFSWAAAPASAFAVNQYEVKLTTPLGAVTTQVVAGLTWTTRANWVGNATLSIKSIDILGNYSTTGYNTTVTKVVPNAPTSVTFSLNDAQLTTQWTAVARATNGLPVGGYEIRTNNGTWGSSDANLVWRGTATSTIIKTLVSGANTWYINSFDTDNNYGTTGTAITFTCSKPGVATSITSSLAGTSTTGSTATFNWTAPSVAVVTASSATSASGQLPLSGYIVSLTKPAPYAALSNSATLSATSWTVPADWVGSATLSIITVDVLGNQSTATTATTSKALPLAPSTPKFTTNDSQLFVDWDDVAVNTNGLPVAGYEIRTANTNWGTTGYVWRGSVSSAILKNIALGLNTWYINTFDTDNKYAASGTAAVFTSTKPGSVTGITSVLAGTSTTGSTVTINWTAPTVTGATAATSPTSGQFPLDNYIVTLTKPAPYAALSNSAVLSTTSWTVPADWVGTATLSITTADVLGNQSTAATANVLKALPLAPASATFTVSDSQLFVDWDDVAVNTNGLPVAGYEIRTNNIGQGSPNGWGTSGTNLIWRGSVSNTIIKNTQITGGATNTWYISTFDTDNKYAATGTQLTFVAQRPGIATGLTSTISTAGNTPLVTFGWTPPTVTTFKIAKYRVRLTKPDASFVEATLDATNWTVQINWTGTATFTIVSIDLLGTESSTSASTTLNINAPSQPGVVTSKASGKSMDLSWATVAINNTGGTGLPIAGYELRDANTNWGSVDANLIWRGSVSGFSLNTLFLGSSNYFLSAYDIAGAYSTTSRPVTVTVAVPDNVTTATPAYSFGTGLSGATATLYWNKPAVNAATQFELDYYLITITKPGPIVTTAKSLTNEYTTYADWSNTATVTISAVDVLGYSSATAATITVPKLKPTAPTTVIPTVSTAGVILTWPEVAKTSLPVAGYEIRTTTTGWGTGGHVWKGSTLTTQVIPAQGFTTQTWYIKTFDSGNEYSTAFYTINLTTLAPGQPSTPVIKYTDTTSTGAMVSFDWLSTKATGSVSYTTASCTASVAFDIVKYYAKLTKPGPTVEEITANTTHWNTTADWNGTATLDIIAYDSLGNASTTRTTSATKTPPGTPSTVISTVNTSLTGINLKWTAATAGSLPILGYELRPTGSTPGTTLDINALTVDVSILQLGANTWNLFAYDTDGRYTVTPASVTYTVAAPGAATGLSYSFNTNLTSSTALFKWTAPATSAFGIKQYKVSFATTNPVQTLTSTRNSTDWEIPANWLGSGTLSVTVVDYLNNESTVATLSCTKAVPNSAGAVLTTVQGTNIALDWPDTATSTNGLPVLGYEIRSTDTNWGSAGYTWKGSTSNYTVNLKDITSNPGGYVAGTTLTWYLKPFDTDKRYSTAAASASYTISAPTNTVLSAPYFEDTSLTNATVALRWTDVSPIFGLKNYEVAGQLTVNLTTAAGSAVATVIGGNGTKGFNVGDTVINVNIPAGTTITAITSTTQITLSTSGGVLAGTAVSSTIINYSYTSANNISLPADWLGDKIFIVKVVDLLNNKSTGVQQTVTKTIPDAPTNFRAQVIDNTVLLFWNLPAISSLPIALTRLKKGTTWAGGTLIGDKSGTFTTITELAGGDFTYWIAAVDTDDNESAPVNLAAKVSAPPDYVFNAQYTSTLGGISKNYVSNTSTTLVLDTTAGLTAGMLLNGNGYTSGQTIASIVDSTTILTSAAPNTTPVAGVAIIFGTPYPNYVSNTTTTLVLTSTSGIAPGMPLSGNGYTSGQTVVSITNSTTLVTSAAPTTAPVAGQPIRFGFSNALKEANTGYLELPIDPVETFAGHFTSRGWTTPNAQVLAGYPIYIQPGLTTGYYEELFDYGTNLGSSQISVALSGTTIIGNPAVQITISTSSDNITYTNYAGSSSVFATNFRYIKVRVSVSQTVSGDIYQISSLVVRLDAKQKTDSNTTPTNGVVLSDAGGTVVNFVSTFVDVTSITLTPLGTVAQTAVYDFKDTYASGTYVVASGTPTLCTITQTAHGYKTGQNIKVAFVTGGAPSSVYNITVVNANTYTVTLGTAVVGGTSGSSQAYPQSMCIYLYDSSGNRTTGTVSWTVRGY